MHTAGVTAGSVQDTKVMDNLIREDDRAVYGGKAYACGWKKRAAKTAGVLWAVKAKAQAVYSVENRYRQRRRVRIWGVRWRGSSSNIPLKHL